MQTKKYKGFVVAAPPHLNPQNKPDRYAFSGLADPSGDFYACSFTTIPVPGFTQPHEFAGDVAAEHPLPGHMELYPTDWKLGMFRYISPASSEATSTRSSDAMELSREQLREPQKSAQPKEPDRAPELRELPQPGKQEQQKKKEENRGMEMF
jgi:hypothetical protein